jgi:hypothetical protein
MATVHSRVGLKTSASVEAETHAGCALFQSVLAGHKSLLLVQPTLPLRSASSSRARDRRLVSPLPVVRPLRRAHRAGRRLAARPP